MKKTHIFCKSSALQMTYKICEYNRAFVLLVYYTTLRSKVKSHLKNNFRPSARRQRRALLRQTSSAHTCLSRPPCRIHGGRARKRWLCIPASQYKRQKQVIFSGIQDPRQKRALHSRRFCKAGADFYLRFFRAAACKALHDLQNVISHISVCPVHPA